MGHAGERANRAHHNVELLHEGKEGSAKRIPLAHQSTKRSHRLGVGALQLQDTLHEGMRLFRPGHFEQFYEPYTAVSSEKPEIDFIGLFDTGRASILDGGDACFELSRCVLHSFDGFPTGCLDSVVGMKRYAQGIEIDLCGVSQRHRNDTWVAPVNPGDDGQQRVKVFNGSRQGADLPERIERPTWAGEMTGARNTSGGRLDGGDARAMGRKAYAPTRIAAQADLRTCSAHRSFPRPR